MIKREYFLIFSVPKGTEVEYETLAMTHTRYSLLADHKTAYSEAHKHALLEFGCGKDMVLECKAFNRL